MTVETDQTKIALIDNNISYIQRDISDIKSAIDKLAGVYITKLQFDDLQKSIDKRLTSVENNRNLWRYATPILTSVLTAITTFLVIFYVQNFKK